MTRETFAETIGFPRGIVLPECTEEEIARLPQEDFLCERYRKDAPDKVLALFLGYLSGSEKDYLARGVTREEWLATMGDLVLWAEQLRRESGEWGIRETHWLAHLVRTEIFRLGRLQFIPRRAERETAFGAYRFPAGTPYAEIHIPAGGRLWAEEVDRSLRRARELLAPAFFSCESWLLSPKLSELLSSGNILSFAARFVRTHFDPSDRSAERYLFGTVGAAEGYSAQTELAEKVKALALRHEAVGSALGYLV